MHVVVLVLTIFYAAADGQPAHVDVKGLAQPASAETRASCPLAGEALSQQLMQDPKVNYVAWGCFEVTNPKDKAA